MEHDMRMQLRAYAVKFNRQWEEDSARKRPQTTEERGERADLRENFGGQKAGFPSAAHPRMRLAEPGLELGPARRTGDSINLYSQSHTRNIDNATSSLHPPPFGQISPNDDTAKMTSASRKRRLPTPSLDSGGKPEGRGGSLATPAEPEYIPRNDEDEIYYNREDCERNTPTKKSVVDWVQRCNTHHHSKYSRGSSNIQAVARRNHGPPTGLATRESLDGPSRLDRVSTDQHTDSLRSYHDPSSTSSYLSSQRSESPPRTTTSSVDGSVPRGLSPGPPDFIRQRETRASGSSQQSQGSGHST